MTLGFQKKVIRKLEATEDIPSPIKNVNKGNSFTCKSQSVKSIYYG